MNWMAKAKSLWANAPECSVDTKEQGKGERRERKEKENIWKKHNWTSFPFLYFCSKEESSWRVTLFLHKPKCNCFFKTVQISEQHALQWLFAKRALWWAVDLLMGSVHYAPGLIRAQSSILLLIACKLLLSTWTFNISKKGVQGRRRAQNLQ